MNNNEYKTTVGIEIHCELKSKSKMFSPSTNGYAPTPNLNINEIDFAYPGVLPTINMGAVELALKSALVLNCEINKEMFFDRKNYFYPDLPKGYQITQSRTPIGINGYIDLGNGKKVRIHDIHIEEDTAKSIHHNEKSLLDFNRCGVPLVEIVSEADMNTPEDAKLYVEKLRELLFYTGVTDAKIEEGSMRCDVNVSVSKTEQWGTRTEIKNVSSIFNVGLAIEKEALRQIHELENGRTIIEETRRFDETKQETILMRKKEVGNDYRYFPEPDIPKLVLTDEYVENIKNSLPILPNEIRQKYSSLNVSEINIEKLIQNKPLNDFLINIEGIDMQIASNLLLGDITSYLNKNNKLITDTKLTPSKFKDLVLKLSNNEITNKIFKDIYVDLLETDMFVNEIIDKKGLKSIDDTNALTSIINNILDNNPESIKDYFEGRDRAIKFLMGQVMKETKGSANPKIANDILKIELDKRNNWFILKYVV